MSQLLSPLFLDRDGVINRRIIDGYVTEPSQWIFENGVLSVLARLAHRFFPIIVVTNQQGISKGLMTEIDLHRLHQHMLQQVGAAGGRIDAVYYCPHLATDQCHCRKPRIGMALQAQRDWGIDLQTATMVGDSVSDLQFGQAAAMRRLIYIDAQQQQRHHHSSPPPQLQQIATLAHAVMPSLAAAFANYE